MERRRTSVAFLDTHIAVWLYDSLINKLSDHAASIIETCELNISPMVMLELQYLYEIKRITVKPKTLIHYLETKLDLRKDETDFSKVIDEAMSFIWTRDPFDRIIVAHAKCRQAYLVTADQSIHSHYPLAVI